MRFVSSVLIGGALIGLLMPEMPAARLLVNAPMWLLAVVAIPMIIGVIVQRRAWLASAAALAVGVVLWIAFYLRPSPPWASSDNWNAQTWVMFVAVTLLPWTLLAALAGALGGWMRRVYSSRFLSSR